MKLSKNKNIIEFKVKIPRQTVQAFLNKLGINADDVQRMIHRSSVEDTQERNQIFRHQILKMMEV